MNRTALFLAAALTVSLVFASLSCTRARGPSEPTATAGVTEATEPTEAFETIEDEGLRLGRTLFLRYCAECHGENGDGWGLRHDITYARPRSFMVGRFKLATTVNRIPSDQDLQRVIRLGMPGAGMPSWSQLPDDEIATLAAYVRFLGVAPLRRELNAQVAAGLLSAEEAAVRLAERTVPGASVEIPPETGLTTAGLRRGGEIYIEACAPCHGERGDAPPGSLKTDLEGNWLLPTSLATGTFKGGSEGSQIYARIVMGMDGTAMPAFEDAYPPKELWDLVHFVQSLSAKP